MSGANKTTWRRAGDDRVIKRRVAGEIILVPFHARLVDMSRLYMLDEVSEHIWDRLEYPREMAVLAGSVCENFDVSEAQALADTQAFLDDLAAAGLAEKALAS